MTISEARAALRRMNRRTRRLHNGRYHVRGVWPSVRAMDLPAVVAGLQAVAR